MRRLLVGLVAGAVLGSAGAGGALVRVPDESQLVFRGVICRTNAQTSTMLCIRQDGRGFAVGYGARYVVVANQAGLPVFQRRQPK